MQADVFAHEPAQRPDLQSIFSGIIQSGFDQLAAQPTIPDSGRDARVGENDDVPLPHVIEHSQVIVNSDLEALLFEIMCNLDFCFHRFIFIPICDLVKPNFS